MGRVKLHNLPEEISMRRLSTLLGYGGALDEPTLNAILLATQCNSVPIYFKEALSGSLTSGC